MKTILITGANGFIGSHLADLAIKKGYRVLAAVRKTSDVSYLKDKSVIIKYIDLSDKDKVISLLQNIQETEGRIHYIIHNAGLTQNKAIKDFYRVNYEYTVNLVEAIKQAGIAPEKFVYTSSISAVGPGELQPDKILNHNARSIPVTYYGKSKQKVENFLLEQGLPVIIFRAPPVYGPGEVNMLQLFKAIKYRLSPGLGIATQKLSAIYVKDLAEYFLRSLESDITHKVYFISDFDNYSSFQINKAIEHALQIKAIRIRIPLFFLSFVVWTNEFIQLITGRTSILNRYKFKEIATRNWKIDPSEAIRDFYYMPVYDIRAGMLETYKWYKEKNFI